MAEASSSKAPTSTPNANVDDIDKLLAQEESAFQRDFEVERIMKSFRLNPYAILDLEPGATDTEIKKKYRSLSLFIHPDKASHAQASEAFDRLKKAESELSDKTKRDELDGVYVQARALVLKTLSLPSTISDDDPKVRELQPGLKERIQQQTKELLINEEVRRRTAVKLAMANEGLEAKKKEEEVLQRKRKAEDDKAWEEGREQRVDSWRAFASGKKKKKAKTNVLG
ncbi:hypothetical protein M407DRAFT_244802 [Tulasnella calospora MUT 4182]|uniref:J domain-containing protein n=1 Tax=Tulasnella calospora MUT 4182 TaxID=1051891 RepID=A0A0C3KPU7_9AGAM|nr:hypothetical protein M407DRAFT_244802 [Tulasnella calospora MUT 4182]